ncbi:MAG: AAA family ATPase [Oscillospiraceae bacterium]|nr:AAA family ATPase [Oscillospiraceae bacterium]
MNHPDNETKTVSGTFLYTKNKNNSDYCINVLETADADLLPASLTVKGKNRHGKYEFIVRGYNLPAVNTLKVNYHGKWESTRYGEQFNVTSFDYVMPTTEKGIISYLCSNRFVGIGRARAKKIVDTYHEKTFDVIRETPEKLLTIRGLTVSIIQNAHDRLVESESFNRLAVFLGTYGVTSEKISMAYAKWGADAEKILSKNPFILTQLPGCGFALADQIARGMNVMLDSDERIMAAIYYALQEESMKGNLYTDPATLFNESMRLLNEGLETPAVDKAKFRKAFDRCKAKGIICCHGGERFIYSAKNERAEYSTARNLLRLLGNNIPDGKQRDYIKAIYEYRKTPQGSILSDKQVAAVINAICNRVAIITGGPGTGKTTIVKCLISAYRQVEGNDAEVTLIAPTGKAANRMSESTGLPASTIHSRIHMFSDDMDPEQCETLPEGLIVVDEFSMVDMYVMEKMMASIRTTGSHLVMCGDTDQLPSVGPGAVLNQMIRSKVIPTSRLTEIFRQKGGPGLIVENTHKVNTGDTNLTYGEGFTMVNASGEEEALEKILHIYKKEVEQWGTENVALLCPMRRKRVVSVDNINKILQDVCNPRRDGEVSASINGTEFRLGDRVIQTKNTLDASNGDIGVVTDISIAKNEDGENEAVFTIRFENREPVIYNRDKMLNVQLAYSLSIHKSQGSGATCS